jgi:hypothetical protein
MAQTSCWQWTRCTECSGYFVLHQPLHLAPLPPIPLLFLQMNLAGLLLNAKSDGGDELLNLTVDTVQCALLTTTRQRQLSLGVLSVQLDNQLLATRHPVVLSPASLAEVSDNGAADALWQRHALSSRCWFCRCFLCTSDWLLYMNACRCLRQLLSQKRCA